MGKSSNVNDNMDNAPRLFSAYVVDIFIINLNAQSRHFQLR